MTLLSPDYKINIGGHDFATYADGLEAVDGLDTLPGRRLRRQPGAYRDGVSPYLDTPSFFDAKRQRLRIWVSSTNADGNVTYAKGPAAHLRENVETIMGILAGGTSSNLQVDWTVPTPSATRVLRNWAQISTPLVGAGSSRLVRRFPITLDYPWPFFRDNTAGETGLGPFTGSQSFTPLGNAPLADAELVCSSAGRITHDESGDFVEVSATPSGSVTIDQRPPRSVTDGGGDARDLYNANHGWGLRFPANVLANLTITGTWAINYYDAVH